jgi:hypothetical protein
MRERRQNAGVLGRKNRPIFASDKLSAYEKLVNLCTGRCDREVTIA